MTATASWRHLARPEADLNIWGRGQVWVLCCFWVTWSIWSFYRKAPGHSKIISLLGLRLKWVNGYIFHPSGWLGGPKPHRHTGKNRPSSNLSPRRTRSGGAQVQVTAPWCTMGWLTLHHLHHSISVQPTVHQTTTVQAYISP